MLRRRRWGMAERIVLPVTVLFVAFTVALGVWISRLSRDVFLREAQERAAAVEAAALAYLRADWARFAQQLGNPVINQRLAPLVVGENVDAVTRALQGISKTVGADFVHAYTAQLAFLASSREVQSVREPPFLSSLVRSLSSVRENSVYLVALPREALSFEGLDDLRPRPGTGEALAVVAAVPITDDFNERISLVLAFRFLNGNSALVQEVAKITGGEVTVLQGGVRVATTLKTADGKTLEGSALADGQPVRTGGFAGRESAGGRIYEARTSPLLGGERSSAAALSVAVPVSGFLARAGAIQRHILLGGLLALAVVCPLLTWTVRRSVRAVGRLLGHMDSVSKGHLGAKVAVDTTDELGALAAGINETVERLRDLVAEVDASFGEVEGVSASLLTTADALGAGASREGEVVHALDETTGSLFRVVEQLGGDTRALRVATQSSLESLRGLFSSFTIIDEGAAALVDSSGNAASGIHEMSATIGQSATNIASLSELIGRSASAMKRIDRAVGEIKEFTARTREVARALSVVASEKGRGAMERARVEMTDTQRLVSAWGETVRRVGKRSQEIGEIVTLISGVAGQTKLLALNATILAAQAGEHGRGFSVVAENIRQLSEQTNRSVRNIAKLVQSIQDESGRAVEEAERGGAAVARSTAEVIKLSEALERIIAGVADTKELTESIASQTERQAVSSSEVANSLMEIASMSEQLAASAQEQDVTGRDILRLSEEMGRRAGWMKDLTAEQAANVAAMEKRVSSTAEVADRLGESATATTDAARVVRESMEVIRCVVRENQERVASLRESIDRLCGQSEQVRRRLSSFVLR